MRPTERWPDANGRNDQQNRACTNRTAMTHRHGARRSPTRTYSADTLYIRADVAGPCAAYIHTCLESFLLAPVQVTYVSTQREDLARVAGRDTPAEQSLQRTGGRLLAPCEGAAGLTSKRSGTIGIPRGWLSDIEDISITGCQRCRHRDDHAVSRAGWS